MRCPDCGAKIQAARRQPSKDNDFWMVCNHKLSDAIWEFSFRDNKGSRYPDAPHIRRVTKAEYDKAKEVENE
jgi:hypothetical protein